MLRRKRPADSGSAEDPSGLRRFIFGDCDVDDWPAEDSETTGEPWQTFDSARTALHRGDTHEAERLWRAIATMPGIESRHVLQAWHFLRSIGVSPEDDVSKIALGAVAEVAVPQGHDLLAAYQDGSVRYLNFSGAVAVIDAPLRAVQAPAREMLSIGEAIARAIGPWEGPLPEAPGGHSRISVLTPPGPHFGQGADAALRADNSAAAFLDAATRTLVAVVEATGQ
jgi:hypothetical protein